MTTDIITCRGRDATTAGEATGDTCRRTYPRRWGWSALPLTEWYDRARTAGWRLRIDGGVVVDAMCPRCARPDPAVVRLCRDLERGTP